MKKLLIGVALMGLLMQTAKADTTVLNSTLYAPPSPLPNTASYCSQYETFVPGKYSIGESPWDLCEQAFFKAVMAEKAARFLAIHPTGDMHKIATDNGRPCHISLDDSSTRHTEIWYYGCPNYSTPIGPEHFTFVNGFLKEHAQL